MAVLGGYIVDGFNIIKNNSCRGGRENVLESQNEE